MVLAVGRVFIRLVARGPFLVGLLSNQMIVCNSFHVISPVLKLRYGPRTPVLGAA